MADSQQAVGLPATSDGERFERLYRANYPTVLAYALRRASAEQAHDVVAETFLVAWRRLDDIPADVRPWLFGVARRVLANQRRAERRRFALAARLASEPPMAQGGDEDAQRVLAVLAELPERDREALLLVAWDGLDHTRAAAVAGCSRPAFAVRLYRARRRLLKALEPVGQVGQRDRSTRATEIGLEEQA